MQIAANSTSRIYGDANPAFTNSFSGLASFDSAAAFNVGDTTPAVATSNVGSYAITPVVGTPNANYATTLLPGTLSIAQRALQIAANSTSRTYGDANPTFTNTFVGLASFDSAAAFNVGDTTPAVPTSNVGSYAITPVVGTANANYATTLVPGTLSIAQRALQIAANSTSRTYGDANPAFTNTFTGLASFDSAATFNVGDTTPAVATSNVGSYAITPVVGTPNANYATTVLPGTLAISQRALQLVANNATRIYGDANPVFTGTATGLASFDTPASVGLAFNSVGVTANVGNYAISPVLTSTTALGNYAVTATPGVLGITPALLTYVADAQSRTILQQNPTFTGSVTGFRNGDTVAASTTGVLAWTSTATGDSPAGTYAINGAGLSAQNYVFRQAASNATALTVGSPSRVEQLRAGYFAETGYAAVEPRREDKSTYVYDNNLGHPQMCVPDSSLSATGNQANTTTDLLAVEWSRLRARPNVATCFGSGSSGGCSDF